MNSQTLREEQARIAEQAAEWISDLQEAEEKRATFFDWLRASPRHVEETLFVLALSREASALDRDERDALLAEVRQLAATPSGNVVPLASETRTPRNSAPVPAGTLTGPAVPARASRRWMERRRPWMSLAAMVALAAVLSWMGLTLPNTGEYATGAGEQRTVALEDGSLVQLNTRSRVRMNYSPEGRRLRLVSGEALFTVRRDPRRPFTVQTGDTVVEVLGTQFNVYQRPGDTRISVLEGLVQVSGNADDAEGSATARVAAGKEVTVAQGRIGKLTPLDLARTMAWRQRRLVFEDDTLAAIATEFNRYSAKVEIQVDGGVAQERFTGSFDADTPERFIAALTANPALAVEHENNRILIRER
jgi:transmembrane sensor